jgi:hypothetical protein
MVAAVIGYAQQIALIAESKVHPLAALTQRVSENPTENIKLE